MANTNPKEEYAIVSSFKIKIGNGKEETYRRVSGIGISIEDIAYSKDKNIKENRPGRTSADDLTLTRHFNGDKELWNWAKKVSDGDTERKQGSIILLDSQDKQIVRYNFDGAWVKKYTGPTLDKTSNNDILEETVVLSIKSIEMA